MFRGGCNAWCRCSRLIRSNSAREEHYAMSEKTYQPTPRRLRQARKHGEAAVSRELISLGSFLVLWIGLWLAANEFWKHLAHIVDQAARAPDSMGGPQFVQRAVLSVVFDALWVILPLLLLSGVSAVLVGGLQTRGLISMRPLIPRFDRINPATNLRNLFKLRNLLELCAMLVKAALLVGLLAYFIRTSIGTLAEAAYAPPADVLHLGSLLAWHLMGWVAVIYAMAAAFDYALKYHAFMKNLKMSLDEVRRDHKETEGDPHIKHRRRSLGREMIFSNPLARVPGASVVVANPTHFAVALYYKPGETPLPRVVAKGVDGMALQIRLRAQQEGVPVVEERLLARRLFREVAVNHYINGELVDAVAAVFRQVKPVRKSQETSVQLALAETKSDAPHRVNQLGEVGPVDLAPQSGDVHVNDVIEGGGTPDVFPDLVR
jgi:type III secretion protein U